MSTILDFIRHKKITSVFILVFLVLLLWSSAAMQGSLYRVAALIELYFRAHQTIGIFAFIGLSALSAMLSPFSSVPLVPIAIIVWGSAWATAFLIIGWIIGHSMTYCVGYFVGHPMAEKLIPFDKVENYSHTFSKRSAFLLVLLFRLSMPAEIPGYVLGMVRYGFVKYFCATFIAEFPFAILTVYAGEAFLNKKPFILFSAAFIGVAVISIMFYFFRKQISSRQKAVDSGA